MVTIIFTLRVILIRAQMMPASNQKHALHYLRVVFFPMNSLYYHVYKVTESVLFLLTLCLTPDIPWK